MNESMARAAAGTRLREVDLARGLVMILMALDHCRDYLHVDAYNFDPLDLEKTSPILYATRWITHLCAPTFVFLAGVSIFLQSAKGKTGAALSWFLLTRGLWLVFLEVTVISVGWDFAVPWFVFLQVIWAIGVSMIVLAGLTLLPRPVVLGIGLLIVAGHNLVDPFTAKAVGPLWDALHKPTPFISEGRLFAFAAYPVAPWLGVMALGYGVGPVFLRPEGERRRILLIAGLAMLAAFAALRGFNLYGDPSHWRPQATVAQDVMAILNVQKNPPSLDYVLATLGVMALFTSLVLSRLKGAAAHVLAVFGAAPFLFYLLHIYLVHSLAIAAEAIGGKPFRPMLGHLTNSFNGADGTFAGVGYSLPFVYLMWVVVVALLYLPCRYWAGLKTRRRDWWLSYL